MNKPLTPIPVAFESSVTYYEKGNIDLFVQEGAAAIYVETATDLNLQSGDRVRVEGTTRASFRPEIVASRITLLRHGQPLPPPVDANIHALADLKVTSIAGASGCECSRARS